MNYLIAVIPVLAFLAALRAMDSYELVSPRTVAASVAAGLIAALAAFAINRPLSGAVPVELANYRRYISPFVEESCKGAWIAWLILRRRTGFTVDAAIHGFAVGAGFAAVENVYYLAASPGHDLVFGIVRGFGPALMHGAATAVLAVVARSALEEHGERPLRALAPAWLLAVAIHSVFNHFFISPLSSALSLVIGTPVLMAAVFRRSERSLRTWLGMGFDADAQMLEMIVSGDIADTHVGSYLRSLKRSFAGETVADMLCYLRLHLELSIRAKGILLMRENGFDPPRDPEIGERFDELRYLERQIGVTGKLAMHPLLRWSARDLWQLTMLSQMQSGRP